MKSALALLALASIPAIALGAGATSWVTVEAESGTLGAQFATAGTSPAAISVTTNNSGSSPADAARVARYQVTFPVAGSYRLFARVRVGSGGAADDSLFIARSFGAKNPANAADWWTINNFSNTGQIDGAAVVPAANSGSAGTGIWKWLDVSALAPTTYTVTAANLSQVFEIGGREDGLEIDKFVFGLANRDFTVEDLLQDSAPIPPTATTSLTLEAESSTFGAELATTTGNPSYLTVATDNSNSPGTAARVMRFQITFPAAGSYRLFARVRVGPGGASDDSLFLGDGFGAKNPATAGDWRTANNFAGRGFTKPTDVVTSSGTAGSGVWKWIDLSALSGLTLQVSSSALVQTLDLGGRENGLDIDKLVLGPADNSFTVADLDAGAVGTPPPDSTALTVHLGDVRQIVDGFGASSAWTAQAVNDALADRFFSPASGLGLSLLRLRIAADGTTLETVTAQKATTRGVKVWATPWGPPAEWKSNNDEANGGRLLDANYPAWAARLANFAATMKSAGVPIAAISAQNEPNYTATWQSCVWTPAELTAFIRDHLGPALASRGLATGVIAPEAINWDTIASYGTPLLTDPAARGFLSQFATHSYGGSPFAYTAPAANGLPFWQTEFTDAAVEIDPTIDSGIRTATAIHDFLTIAQGNAWHYWWLIPRGDGAESTSALVSGTAASGFVMTKRAWALGNFSRFVRPGQRRVLASGSSGTLRASAFIDPETHKLSLVVINSGSSDRRIPVSLDGGSVASLVPWETSQYRSLAALPAVVPDAGGTFTLDLPARSVTTFAGTYSDPSAYTTWSAALPSADRAPDADPDRDGVSNLVAYALGRPAGLPVPPETLPALTAVPGGGQRFTIRLPAIPADSLAYQVESSSDLLQWSPLASKAGQNPWQGDVLPTATALPDGSVSCDFTLSASSAPRFLRLRCTLLR